MMPDSFTIKKYNQLLREFHVKNEQQLLEKLEQDSLTLPCQFCRREVSINEIHFFDSDPVCDCCWRRIND